MPKFVVLRKIVTIVLLAIQFAATSQTIQDSVVQLSGVVMTADSLRALPYASITLDNQNRGTVTNEKGIFSIVALKGDWLTISNVGYRSQRIQIPYDIIGKQHSILQLMVTDTVYQPVVIIKPRPTPEQFQRDFINAQVEDDDVEAARKNNDEAKRRVLLETLPTDGREAANFMLSKNAARYYYNGQAPPQNLFSPIAWGQFIKAWKRGDFKRKRR
jgi:hypothetical protein